MKALLIPVDGPPREVDLPGHGTRLMHRVGEECGEAYAVAFEVGDGPGDGGGEVDSWGGCGDDADVGSEGDVRSEARGEFGECGGDPVVGVGGAAARKRRFPVQSRPGAKAGLGPRLSRASAR